MPRTLAGVAIFLLGLSPGLCYFFVRSRRRPRPQFSALQETGAVLLVSLACHGTVLLIFAVLRLVLPQQTPAVSRLVLDAGQYWKESYVFLTWWGVSLFLSASVLGGIIGWFELGSRWGPIVPDSAWGRMLLAPKDDEVYVRCQLLDGSYVGGYLGSATPQYEETADRDLVLVAPIRVQTSRVDKAKVEKDISALILSARNIVRLDVAYLPPGTAEKERASEGVAGDAVEIPQWPPRPG